MSAGKVFHGKAYARQKNEKYYTPPWATEIVMPYFDVRAEGWTWEPAAGDGQIVNVIRKYTERVTASDLSPDNDRALAINFLTCRAVHQSNINKIITNPPFGPGGQLAFQFCWHALRLMEPVKGKVAMLMRDDFDSAGGRRLLFKGHPAWHQKIVILERIRWTNLEQKKAGPSGAHAWFIWDWAREPGPAIVTYEGRQP